MKILNSFKSNIQDNVRDTYLGSGKFKEDLILQNARRGKILAIIVIVFETIFASIDIVACFLEVSKTFSFYLYLAMYLIMIAINITYLFLINGYEKKKIRIKAMNIIIVLYLTLIMLWGSVISLMDQRLYGQLIAYMVNMIICSVIYYLDAKKMIIPYLTSTVLLSVGLPFFQNSSDILIGHYVNLSVFVAISWTASRVIYQNYCDNYVIKELMNQTNSLLEKETKENSIINKKLELANAQLKKIALMDELTGLPNRRCFREFVDDKFQHAGSDLSVSVIMIDVDNFKQYNDSYGHEKGDSALIAVAKQLSDLPENNDRIAIRWGGEEFIYAVFNKSKEEVIKIANTIRLKILELKILNQNSLINPYLTISLGICTANISNTRDIDKIIDTADKAMYKAKGNGRNCAATLDCNELSGERVF